MVCKILALPPDDFGFFLNRVGHFMALSSTPEQARTAAADIADYLAEVVTARKGDLADNLVSELIQKYLIPVRSPSSSWYTCCTCWSSAALTLRPT